MLKMIKEALRRADDNVDTKMKDAFINTIQIYKRHQSGDDKDEQDTLFEWLSKASLKSPHQS